MAAERSESIRQMQGADLSLNAVAARLNEGGGLTVVAKPVLGPRPLCGE
jgi:hypothetical protein